MSRLRFTKTSTPSTPAANKSELFIDTADRKAKQIDDNGVINTLNNDGLHDRNLLTNGGIQHSAKGCRGIDGNSGYLDDDERRASRRQVGRYYVSRF
jgi:hypothetical protein